MTYTAQEYAEMADRARREGKVLEIIGGKLALIDPPQKTLAELDDKRIFEIKHELMILDEKSTRPLRAIIAGSDTEDDHAFLAEIEKQAKTLREELIMLQAHDSDDDEF